METLTVQASGDHYEDAVSKAILKCKDVCGNPLSQVMRLQPDLNPDSLSPMQDWLLDHTETTLSIGGTNICIEATFYLFGSDGEYNL